MIRSMNIRAFSTKIVYTLACGRRLEVYNKY